MRPTIAAVVLMSLVPHLAWADPPVTPPVAPLVMIPPGDDNIVVLKKGDPSPFTGQLFDPATALRWANLLQQCHFRLQADVAYQQKLDQADIDYQKKLVTIEQDKYTRVVTELETKNKQLQVEVTDPPFYKTMWFGVIIGATAAFLAVGFAAWGLNAASK